ncbi:hypothetical protein D3C85_866560 [compost metagenome]
MGARDGKATGGCDKSLVNIGTGQRHVGTVITVENQRKCFLIFDTQDHQCGEMIPIRDEVAGIATNPLELLAQETAHMLIAHPGQHRGLEAQTCRTKRHVT